MPLASFRNELLNVGVRHTSSDCNGDSDVLAAELIVFPCLSSSLSGDIAFGLVEEPEHCSKGPFSRLLFSILKISRFDKDLQKERPSKLSLVICLLVNVEVLMNLG